MEYRSVSDLNMCLVRNLYRLPRDIDLVVGVPRSGLLPANLIALHLNLPLTDLKGLIEQRLIASGPRMGRRIESFDDVKRVLVVDDSVNSGAEMKRVRALLEEENPDCEIVLLAIYVTPGAEDFVDMWLEHIPMPRVFGWNAMHHANSTVTCFDIDGVLCRDPTETENDDGDAYREFLLNVEPLFIPTRELGALVTSRLEKYRDLTETWLAKHGVQYKELVMLDLPTKEDRMRLGNHAEFKAAAYRERTWAKLFIESSASQAQDIANLSVKPVLCIETDTMRVPNMKALTRATANKVGRKIGNTVESAKQRMKEKMLEWNRWQ